MKIAIKPLFLFSNWSFDIDALTPTIKQLSMLFSVVLLAAFLKIYQCYWLQQHVAQHTHLQSQLQHVKAYHKALLLERSTLLRRSQVLADGRRYLGLRTPRHIARLYFGAR